MNNQYMNNQPSENKNNVFTQFISQLGGEDFELTGREIAEIIWLYSQISATEISTTENQPQESKPTKRSPDEPVQVTPSQTQEKKVSVFADSPNLKIDNYHQSKILPLGVPDAPSLREPLQLTKAFKPLMRKVNSGKKTKLDEIATAEFIASQGYCLPILKAEPEPWLDLALVVDESKSMVIWRHPINELKKLLEHYGIFRDVRTWGLVIVDEKSGKKSLQLKTGIGKNVNHPQLTSPKELIDPSGRRLILIVSDCVTAMWRDGMMNTALKQWTKYQPVAILQMLPDYLWLRTGLNVGAAVRLKSLTPGVANQNLLIKELLLWKNFEIDQGIKIPVLSLEPEVAKNWSQMVAGKSKSVVSGFVFPPELSAPPTNNTQTSSTTPRNLTEIEAKTEAEDRVYRFRMTASPIGRKLAGLLAAAPVITLPVVRLLQETMLPDSRQVNVAEVFLGGLLKPLTVFDTATNPDLVQYDFMYDEIRNILLEAAPVSDSIDVVNAVSRYIVNKLGKSLSEFKAILKAPGNEEEIEIKAFAQLTTQILKKLGGEYTSFAQEIEFYQQLLKSNSFDVITVNYRGAETKREIKQNYYFTEKLPNNITLDMVYIPSGTFLMGSPEDEPGRDDDESPQHQVTVQPFFMGKYPVTQAQWKAVATKCPQVNRKLKPNPSEFKENKQGNNLPVESISWYDAIEFCERLSRLTGKKYRLPSEAEWEYACRAGTTTPFHFGETITGELANYNANYTYGEEPESEYRQKTTPVGSLTANAFGLYDMHGDVWEWCYDDWHGDYNNSPNDGSPWLKRGSDKDDNHSQVLRGGS
ncbi:MAG: formylglycine-generating enzyme family protein, partial [Sphaerospermopsis sp.]|nr:formylglycine-generating enzyme family protein [Sphaerospermopsis sp.]